MKTLSPDQALTAIREGHTVTATADLRCFGGEKTTFTIKRHANRYGLPAYRIKSRGRKTTTPLLREDQLSDWLSSLTDLSC